MAFTIDDNIIRIYQDGIDAIIDQLGKKLILINPRNDSDCPNCGFAFGRSNGRYNSSNPNPAGPLNKPFVDGQICPVCQGRGKIKEAEDSTEIVSTIEWEPKEEVAGTKRTIVFPRDVCKCKTYSSYLKQIEDATEFLVAYDEITEGDPNLVKCTMFRKPVPRGLKYNRYCEFFLRKAR